MDEEIHKNIERNLARSKAQARDYFKLHPEELTDQYRELYDIQEEDLTN